MRRLLLGVTLTALGLLSLPVRAAPPPKGRTDVVLLLDVSGSMRKHRALPRARQILGGVLDKIVHPGTNVALIPFGTGVHKPIRFKVPNDPAGYARARAEIRRAIEQVRARDSYTYLYDGIHASLSILREFKETHAEHDRHVILISDGKEVVRRDAANTHTFDGTLSHFENLGFMRREDWFIWYAHFGEPDAVLQRKLESTGAGRVISLDDLPSLAWAYTRVESDDLDLGRRTAGDWETEANLRVVTDKAGKGRELRLAIVGELPEGMELSIEPETFKITRHKQEIAVRVRATGARREGLGPLKLRVMPADGALHWVERGEIDVRLEIGFPRIDVGTDLLSLGRLAPGMRRTRAFAILPNDDARARRTAIDVKVEGAPKGVTVTVADPAPLVEGRHEIPVTVVVGADAKEGVAACRLVLSARDGTPVKPSVIRLDFRVGTGRVSVGSDRVAFAPLKAGGEATHELILAPDEETALSGSALAVRITGLPSGFALNVPASLPLEARTTLKLNLAVPAGAKAGDYTATLAFSAPEGVIVDPAELPVTFSVQAPAPLTLPSLVDLGDVPATRAREVSGRLELAVSAEHAGHELELVASEGGAAVEPRVIPLREGHHVVPVRLRSVLTESGAHAARFDAFVTRGGTRRKVGSISFRWRVVESFVRLATFVAPSPTTGKACEAKLVLDASDDVAGRRLPVTAEFRGLPEGMRVEVLGEIDIKAGLQKVALPFTLKGARPGRYTGVIRIGNIPGAATARTIEIPEFELVVAGGLVEIIAVEGSLEHLRKDETRELTLVVRATAAPVPTELQLTFERGGLPAEVQAFVPKTATVSVHDGVQRIPLRFKVVREPRIGIWEARLSVRALTADVAVAGNVSSLRATVVAPETIVKVKETERISALWIAVGIGGGLLVGILAVLLLLRRRRNDDDEFVSIELPLESESDSDTEIDDELLKIPELEDDMLVLEGFED